MYSKEIQTINQMSARRNPDYVSWLLPPNHESNQTFLPNLFQYENVKPVSIPNNIILAPSRGIFIVFLDKYIGSGDHHDHACFFGTRRYSIY